MTGQELKNQLEDLGVSLFGFLDYSNIGRKKWNTFFLKTNLSKQIPDAYMHAVKQSLNNIRIMKQSEKEEYGLCNKPGQTSPKPVKPCNTWTSVQEVEEIDKPTEIIQAAMNIEVPEVEETQTIEVSQNFEELTMEQSWSEFKKDKSIFDLIKVLEMAEKDINTLRNCINSIQGH